MQPHTRDINRQTPNQPNQQFFHPPTLPWKPNPQKPSTNQHPQYNNKTNQAAAVKPTEEKKSPQIRRRQRLHHTCALAEPRPKDAVRVLEHAVLERHDNELRPFEPRLDQAANVLRVRQVQRGVDLVQDVHGRRLELEEGHDEGEGD